MDIGFVELLKVILLGIVEGITEWLPISSTGHMLLLDEFIKLEMSEEFKKMFIVVIQLGAIFAVVLIYFKKLWPFSLKEKHYIKKDIWSLWFKILIACLPAVIASLFNDKIDEVFMNAVTVTITLVVYGILFIIIENMNLEKKASVKDISDITYKMAFLIGIFQVLAVIPGTSRSGATIIGGLILGASRYVAAEFTFFLAIPVMFGASLLKIVKFGLDFTQSEIVTLAVGMLTAFLVSIVVIKFFIGFIKKHDFKIFGYYRIILGVLVGSYFLLAR